MNLVLKHFRLAQPGWLLLLLPALLLPVLRRGRGAGAAVMFPNLSVLVSLGRRSALERTAYMLLHLFARAEEAGLVKGNTIQFPFTQQHVADTLGMSLVHANKTIKRLMATNAVRWKDRVFELIDRTGDSTLFFDLPPGLSDIPGDHSTFLWQSECLWLVTQAARWGQISEIPRDAEALARKAWRSDLYREIAAEMDIPCPTEDYKVEPAQVFIDQKAFDPSELSGYLNSFEIRAQAPQQFGLRTTRL